MKIVFDGAQRQNFNIQFPIMKSEQLDDGRLMIEGIATSEALDHAGEIVDYESAKAAFADWKGNIREQHDPKKAVGKAVEVVCDDELKQVIVKAFISKGAPDTQEKVKDGTLTGFSIGGSVASRKTEKFAKGDGTTVDAVRVMVKRISETSVVDAGCNPETAIAIVKADGDALLGIGLEDAAEPGAIDALAELLNKGEITPERLIELAKADKAPAEAPIKKGMWGVQDFAGVLMSLGYIARESQCEADYEGDGSVVPAQLRAWIMDGIKIFQAMAAEEANELIADLKSAAGEVDVIELALRGGDLAKGGAKFSKDSKDKLAKAHKAVKDAADHLASTGYEASDDEGDGGDADKSAVVEDLAKVNAAHGELAKALADAGCTEGQPLVDFVKSLVTDRDALKKQVEDLKALPAPGKALLKAVSKSQDIGETLGDDKKDTQAVVKTLDGEVNEVASLIKQVHQTGGIIHR
ncbi:HK97 family phage prohead protease [Herbaspirillum sp. RV1423]|uniref:HK97 family phage prohead protease n=1 Tax=Herbaspirillum sp. RV1423 TaxID=1443993 RepID=UPI0004BBC728|nr:HK97 family phage prohead protease [Herbaspirillum sp. RV1423]